MIKKARIVFGLICTLTLTSALAGDMKFEKYIYIEDTGDRKHIKDVRVHSDNPSYLVIETTDGDYHQTFLGKHTANVVAYALVNSDQINVSAKRRDGYDDHFRLSGLTLHSGKKRLSLDNTKGLYRFLNRSIPQDGQIFLSHNGKNLIKVLRREEHEYSKKDSYVIKDFYVMKYRFIDAYEEITRISLDELSGYNPVTNLKQKLKLIQMMEGKIPVEQSKTKGDSPVRPDSAVTSPRGWIVVQPDREIAASINSKTSKYEILNDWIDNGNTIGRFFEDMSDRMKDFGLDSLAVVTISIDNKPIFRARAMFDKAALQTLNNSIKYTVKLARKRQHLVKVRQADFSGHDQVLYSLEEIVRAVQVHAPGISPQSSDSISRAHK